MEHPRCRSAGLPDTFVSMVGGISSLRFTSNLAIFQRQHEGQGKCAEKEDAYPVYEALWKAKL